MDFNCLSDLIETDDASKEFFTSLDASVQQRLLDNYTEAANLDELKTYADVVMNEEK